MKISVIGADCFIAQDTGLPVEGRIKVWLRDSDDYANIYTLEGQDFVQAVNPQLVHGGYTDSSIFAEAGIYRIALERYIGPEGAMSTDSPDEYFEPLDIYEVGLDWDSAMSTATQVDTVADLTQADPALKAVNVLGYHSIGDCPSRIYIWDAAAVDAVDGGYVVGSNVSDTGRWILLWGDEILPCSVYGVSPSNIANLNALLGYASTVGSIALKTAPCVRFTRGDYAPASDIATTKEIVMDGGARFTAGTIQCPKVRVLGSRSSYAGDFALMAPDAEAHSSWFRTLDAFWHCGAQYLYVDSGNHFTESVIRRNVDLTGRTVHGNSRIAATYTAGKYFRVASNTAISGRIFNANLDFVKVGQGHGDAMFLIAGAWDPGLISDGHHVEFEYVPDLDLFENTDRWLRAMVERRGRLNSTQWADYEIDFQSRPATVSVDIGAFTKVSNLVAKDGIVIHSDCAMHNVEGAVTVNAASCTLSLTDSTITIAQGSAGLTDIVAEDSTVLVLGSAGLNPADTSIAMKGGAFAGNIRLGDLNANSYTLGKTVSFTGVKFPAAYRWILNNIAMKDCEGPVSLDILPYADGGRYSYSCNLVGNTFTGAARIFFTIYATSTYQHPEIAGALRFQGARIVGNRFYGTDPRGIYAMIRHPLTLANLYGTDAGSYEYHDNCGACPRPTPGVIENSAAQWATAHTAGLVKWLVSHDNFNVFAPYAGSTDGSIATCRDVSGMVPAPAGLSLAHSITGVGTGNDTVVITGFVNACTLPTDLDDLWDPEVNNLFNVFACITVMQPVMPAPTQGYLLWEKPNV